MCATVMQLQLGFGQPSTLYTAMGTAMPQQMQQAGRLWQHVTLAIQRNRFKMIRPPSLHPLHIVSSPSDHTVLLLQHTLLHLRSIQQGSHASSLHHCTAADSTAQWPPLELVMACIAGALCCCSCWTPMQCATQRCWKAAARLCQSASWPAVRAYATSSRRSSTRASQTSTPPGAWIHLLSVCQDQCCPDTPHSCRYSIA